MKKSIVLTLALLALPAFAAPANEEIQALSQKVTADGQLYGAALACELPVEDTDRLFDQQLNSAKDTAVAKNLAYSPMNFSADYKTGMSTAKEGFASVSTDEQARTKFCDETRQKLAAAKENKS